MHETDPSFLGRMIFLRREFKRVHIPDGAAVIALWSACTPLMERLSSRYGAPARARWSSGHDIVERLHVPDGAAVMMLWSACMPQMERWSWCCGAPARPRWRGSHGVVERLHAPDGAAVMALWSGCTQMMERVHTCCEARIGAESRVSPPNLRCVSLEFLLLKLMAYS